MCLNVVGTDTKSVGDVKSSKYATSSCSFFNRRRTNDASQDLSCAFSAVVRTAISSPATLIGLRSAVNKALHFASTSLLYHLTQLGADKYYSLPTKKIVPFLELSPFRRIHLTKITYSSKPIATVNDVYDELIRMSNLSLPWNHSRPLQPEMESIAKPCWNSTNDTNLTISPWANEDDIFPRAATQARSAWVLELAQCC